MNANIIPQINELLALRHFAPKLRLYSKNKVDAVTTGSRLSFARGRGMDFEEVRGYQSGDDMRLIHWPLTARLGKPFTKIYREEKERAVYLLIDQSMSMRFGTKVCFKSVLAAKIAAVIGFASLANSEQVGGIVFNEHHAEFIKAKRSTQTLMTIFSYLNKPETVTRLPGNLNASLDFLSRRLATGSIVIVISDFYHADAATINLLQQIAKKNKVINYFIYDPIEQSLPEKGFFPFTDERNQRLEIAANSRNKARYQENFNERLQKIKSFSQMQKIQFAAIATHKDIVAQINHGENRHG